MTPEVVQFLSVLNVCRSFLVIDLCNFGLIAPIGLVDLEVCLLDSPKSLVAVLGAICEGFMLICFYTQYFRLR